MSEQHFTKLQGMGNDFLIVEVEEVSDLPDAERLARDMCDRRYGAGADGLIFVARAQSAEADFDSRIFNSDGSEAGVSGNGTRCVAAYVYFKELWRRAEVRIRTAAGVKHGRLAERGDTYFEFEFDMGEPRLHSEAVPMLLDHPLEYVVRYPLHIGGDMIEVTCLSMGNPQCLIFVSELERVNLAELGPLLEHHPVFPDRANVEFIRVMTRDEIEIRIWERGAGHTLSSGTGSCASAVAAALNGYTDREVRVYTEGGALHVKWRGDNHVWLTGGAEVIYEGRLLRG
ncbi:MAG TPA: diaminopimelate epimerase [Blastocatellia bacterium]|nr:diaminopimelate epimerase [Blastocatellia bacterium]